MTIQFFTKLVISAFIIALSSELAKRSTFFAAILISLPLTSILGLIWTYYETRSAEKVMSLSNNILLMVIPSLVFFALLPLLLKAGARFELALVLSMAGTAVMYGLYVVILKRFGVFI
jgi:ABC-type dipeptide/oligopeptide/nickel transport system permease subunit